ncbi:MAG TPA: hypothetical protein VNN08_26000, partial [Thermoanaerobaculia bacterium]|nr:hypothetical protein [Thermoanaerobaculia bacterium]
EDLALCRVVAERAAQTLKWEEGMRNAPLLDFALHHLTLGRAALYAAILESRGRQRETVQLSPPTSEQSLRGFTTAATELDQAVSGLRRASVQHHLPRGLLTRAWLRSLTGARSGSESAQSDLDEAWEIAERGPMPLFLADIHLYRARLFLREVKYPWDKNPDGTRRGPKDDLAAARVIIERCGYWRRKEELDDADAAAKSWPDSMPPVAKGKNVMRKTIVELDLKGYSDVARELEENLSAEVVMHFNDQIQTFVDTGLSAVSLHREDAVMATTGDGAILALDSPSIAHRYALAVHHACRLHNQERTVASAKRWFRVGIATGDLAIEANAGVKRMAGSVIARAVRLETASNVGEILVDTETYAGLSDQQKLLYGGEETIHGKRDEVFAARRCVAVPGIAVAPTSPAKARSVPAKPNAALEIWREKLEYLQGQFAIVTSPTQKFELKSQIAEAKEMIEELGG